MDYDARISRLETAIEWMTGADSITLDRPAPIDPTEWGNSESQEAAEAFFSQLESFLANYQATYEDCLDALRNRKEQLEHTKLELYQYYNRELIDLSGEERRNYLDKATIDPSVKKMLR